jgi:hypothetical protein
LQGYVSWYSDGLRPGRTWFDFLEEQEIFSLLHAFRSVIGRIQHLMQCVSGGFPPTKQPMLKADHSPPTNEGISYNGNIPQLLHSSAGNNAYLIKNRENLSIHLQSISGSIALVDLGRFFNFLIYTHSVGLLRRGISPSQGRHLHTEQQKQNKRTETSMPRVGFEPTIKLYKKLLHLCAFLIFCI